MEKNKENATGKDIVFAFADKIQKCMIIKVEMH